MHLCPSRVTFLNQMPWAASSKCGEPQALVCPACLIAWQNLLPGTLQLPWKQAASTLAGLRTPRARVAPRSCVSWSPHLHSHLAPLSPPSVGTTLVQLALGEKSSAGPTRAPENATYLAAHSSLIPWRSIPRPGRVWCAAPRLESPDPSRRPWPSQAHRKSAPPHSPNQKTHQGRQSPCLLTGGGPKQVLLSFVSVCRGPEQAQSRLPPKQGLQTATWGGGLPGEGWGNSAA